MTKANGTKKKEHPVIKRMETRMLRHLFTAPETESMTKELASKTLQLRSKMEEKKAIDSQLKGEIDGLASQCNVLAEKVSAGFEVRSVKCQIVLDYGANTKVVTREDTNEVVDSTSPIPPDDRQMYALALGGSGEEVLYRFTIGSADDTELAFWEPNAPKLADRVTSLAKALEAGYQTSVSMEPMLDAEPWKLIEVIRPLVSHSIWLGLPNFMAKRLTTNMAKGPDYEHAMTRALRLHSLQNEKWVHALYQKYREDKLVRWKDSIKKLVGLPPPARAGLDI